MTTDSSRKRTRSSVTTAACKCSWLERAAAEPENPVFFDSKMGEYQLRHSDGGYSALQHCPWCGGAAPKSKRSSFFASVPSSEWSRLASLTAGVKTVEEAVQKFGPPESGDSQGLTIYPSSHEREPQRAESYRTVTFSNMSKVANVVLHDYGPKGIGFSFTAKYLGTPKSTRARSTSRLRRPTSKRRGKT